MNADNKQEDNAPNRTREIRKRVLGWGIDDLRDAIREVMEIPKAPAETTIRKVEMEGIGSEKTKVRILRGLNYGLMRAGKDELSFEEVYPNG